MIVDHTDAAGALRRLALPSALALSADQLLGIVDTIVVGGLGATALAGITAAGSVVVTLIIALWAFGSGARIVAAQAIGAGQPERVGVITRSSLVVPLAIAVASTAAALLGGRALMAAMLGPIPVADAASNYLLLRTASTIAIVIDGAAIAAFSAAGDTTLTLRLLVLINIVHIPLVVALTHGFGGLPGLGLTGAGLSSLLSECAGLAFVLVAAHRRRTLHLTSTLAIEPRLVALTARLAWPQFIFLVVMVAPEPITVALLAPYGAPAVGAFRALSLVSDVTWSLPGALGDAAEIVLGQRIGARDFAGARAFHAAAVRLAVRVCALCGITVAVLAWPLAALFTLDARIASLAALPLALHMLTLPLKGWSMTLLAPIRASGDVYFTLRMGLLTGAIAIAGIAAGIHQWGFGLWSIPLAWIAAWTIRALYTLRKVRKAEWETRTLAA